MERERDPVGDELEELGLVLREAPARLRPDVHHADEVAVREQRHAEEGLDPLLEQDRVQDGAVIDLVEGDRLTLGRDATGEPLPHGDADSAFDLLLDALGGAGHEFVPASSSRRTAAVSASRISRTRRSSSSRRSSTERWERAVSLTRWTRSRRSSGSSWRVPPGAHLITVRPGRFKQQRSEEGACAPSGPAVADFDVDDEGLLAKAEEALTEIKVAQGLSERHEAVLAALRIRLKGSAGKSLEEMLEAADDAPPDRLGEAIAKAEDKGKPSLDDLLGKEPKKPDWPS